MACIVLSLPNPKGPLPIDTDSGFRLQEMINSQQPTIIHRIRLGRLIKNLLAQSFACI